MGGDMEKVTETCEVDAPISAVYNQFTQFEEFPRFMEGVEHVHQLDDKTLEWTAEIGGQSRTWTAEIVDQEPDRLIAWRALDGENPSGSVTFERLPDQRTQVRLEFTWRPEGLKEKAGALLGVDSMRVKRDLDNFKNFIESHKTPTGAWRGEIDGSDVER
jgi:uncharacterized membrane protein